MQTFNDYDYAYAYDYDSAYGYGSGHGYSDGYVTFILIPLPNSIFNTSLNPFPWPIDRRKLTPTFLFVALPSFIIKKSEP